MYLEKTIEFREEMCEIYFWYEAEEPMRMYYPDGSGHPGSPSIVEIDKIFNEDGCDITDDVSNEELNNLEDELITRIEC